jgi:hypothetical protein
LRHKCSGRQGLEKLNATVPGGRRLDRDGLRKILQSVIEGEWPMLRAARWRLVHPPDDRSFVISDNPVTSRNLDWEAGAPSGTLILALDNPRRDVQATQVTWPLTPTACLLVDYAPTSWAEPRVLTGAEYFEVVRRTAMAANQWVWCASEATADFLLAEIERHDLQPLNPVADDASSGRRPP